MPKFCYVKLLPLVLFGLFAALPAHAQQFQPEINEYLRMAKAQWSLTDRDIADYAISDQYVNAQTTLTYTYLHQQIAGIRIFNAVSTMALRNGEVVWFANRFQADAANRANASQPALDAVQAVQAAAAHLGLTLLNTPILRSRDDSRHRLTFDEAGIAEQPIVVELTYVPVENTFRLAWNVNINQRHSADWWNVRIDAANGAFLGKNNWTVSCDFGSVGSGSGRNAELRAPATVPATATAPASYNVYALPLEAPSFGARSLVTDPSLPLASPFGWHDTDGNDGPEYTITRGNNVYAYEDEDANNQPGYSPDGTAALNFDFPIDLSQTPQANRDAIITNLFYMNNMLHDVLYRHGFDEVSGNFQANNYGRGGAADDFVRAEAQDGAGTNNANFSTPGDGQSGRMQMYLWPSGFDAMLTVHTPTGIAGDYLAVQATIGPAISTPITSDVVLIMDDVAPETDGCETILNGAAFAGRIVLIDRGLCTFVEKIQTAEDEGAIAVIVVNNSATTPIAMGGTGTAGIPAVMVSKADGELLKAALAAGEHLTVTLNSAVNTVPDFDGSLDNGIVAHEYGHGLSIRLTGGPSNSNCLNNGEQGGEGWGDWLAMVLSIEPGDAGTDQRGIGTYVLDDATNTGIRRFPYSTDPAINSQNYGDLAASTEVHDIGEIWAQVLWDLTWKLIDAEGFDPDWYNGTGGNNIAMRLVIEGMRLQPCGPGYLDGRNAILMADEALYNGAHRCLIWEAFAGRGMGFDALQGSNSAGDETAGFSLPTYCQTPVTPPTALFSVNHVESCYPTFVFTDQSSDIPHTWLWDFGDGAVDSSLASNPVHTYDAPGTYTVTLTVTNPLGASTHTQTVTYAPLPAPGLSADTSICAGNSVTLDADVLPGNTATWSVDGNIVYSGASYPTPPLTASTTYSVQQTPDFPVQNVGPVSNTFGGGGNHNTGFDGRLLFEAFKPLRLISVLVYAQGAGNRTVTLYSQSGAMLQQVTVPVPNGSSRIILNFEIPGPGEYSIGNVSQNLYRNNGGAQYPYTIANLVEIQRSNATTDPLTYYYYFYDWEVQETGCVSDAAALTVHVTDGPVAAFTTTSAGFDLNLTNTSTGTATSYLWDFGDGTTSTEQDPGTHTYAANGTYTVTLTVGDGACSSTYTETVTILTVGAQQPVEAFGLTVFPNPANRETTVALQGAIAGPVAVELIDAAGRVVLSKQRQGAGQISLPTAVLPAGMYNVRVTAQAGVVVRKLTVAH